MGGQRPSQAAAEVDGRFSLGGTTPAAASTPATDDQSPRSAGAIPKADAPAASASRPSVPVVNAAPALAPRARPAWLMPLLLGLGIGAGAAAAVFFATARGPQPASASPSTAPSTPTPALNAEASPAPIAVATAPAAIEPAATAAPAAETTAAAAPQVAIARNGTTQPAARSDAVARRAGEPQQPADAPAAPDPSATPDDLNPLAEDETPSADKPATPDDASAKTASNMDALLDEALSPDARRNELARRQQLALAEQELPLTPSREDLNQAMTVLLPAIRGCAMGQAGLATAAIVVRGDGRVAGVEISGAPFAGSASGRCMEGVIRRARFTPFRQSILRVKFPLAIQ